MIFPRQRTGDPQSLKETYLRPCRENRGFPGPNANKGKELNTVKELLSRLLTPALDWIQVEVTTRCNASCPYCPREILRDSWEDRLMSAATFDKIARAFRKADHIHLQGWGEPLLHPDLFAMARTAKEMGCPVGTTTNGLLWSDRTSELAVEGQIDVVGFSLAGTDDHQDEVRVGTRLRRVLQAIESLKRAKEKRGSSRPHVHVAYMLLRSGLEDVLGLPRLLEGLGVEQVVVSTLDFVLDAKLAGEALIPEDEAEEHRIRSIMENMVSIAAGKGISVHYRLPSLRTARRTCTENVLHALCVSVDGDVSPCVFTNPAIRRAEFRDDSEKAGREGLVFGNVNRQPLGRIWRESRYKAFRRSHERGDLQPPCSGCTKMLLDP